MTYRPYPARGRALRQILRRHRNELPPGLLPPVAPLEEQGPAGEYRLSTRRR
ncbi:hypothetical protein [Streptomyces spiralis]|uniref:hypothetical protein n=1 Tax=Streptomyces spiralis TaxID=66376 RepID=UPI001674AA97|nr:hypothetical protein [Streptomyces spiralis]